MLQSYRRTVWADRVDLISSHNTEADTGAHSYRRGRYTPPRYSDIVPVRGQGSDPPGWVRTSWLT